MRTMHPSACFIVLVVAIATVNAAVIDEPEAAPMQTLRSNGTAETSTQDPDKGLADWLLDLVAGTTTTTTTAKAPQKPSEPCPSCKCGITNKQNRIVGGVETQVNQYPWMAVLIYKGRFYCGGAVINSKYILTAAHCIDRFDEKLMAVRILEHDRNSTNESETEEFKVEKLIRHSGYSTFNYDNDIALIKVKGVIKFEGKMRPVCLPDRGKTFSGLTGIVTGWGALEEGGSISATLQEVKVPILSNTECRATKYPSRRITNNMLCAGYKEGSKDSCQGDSGGPLHIENNGTHHIVGVVSWGEGCAKPNYPGVYARVNRFLTWIQRNTQDACFC